MHGHVAAGKLVDIAFNDEARQVEICGKVVDDAEWARVEEESMPAYLKAGAISSSGRIRTGRCCALPGLWSDRRISSMRA
jgi:hypothetical protein